MRPKRRRHTLCSDADMPSHMRRLASSVPRPLPGRGPHLPDPSSNSSLGEVPDAALLQQLLGTPQTTNTPAKSWQSVLEDIGGLTQLPLVSHGALGLGPEQLEKVALLRELGLRLVSRPLPTRQPMSPESVWDWARPRLGPLLHEEVWVLCVDARTRLLGATRIAQGGLFGAGLLPRDVFRPILSLGAPAWILVHNHPSGDATPSAEDQTLTERLRLAGQSLGVPLLDHIVIARTEYFSFFRDGLWAPGEH
jgi:DNA repair protein RadC